MQFSEGDLRNERRLIVTTGFSYVELFFLSEPRSGDDRAFSRTFGYFAAILINGRIDDSPFTIYDSHSMTLRVDTEQNEVRALESITDWRRKRVLEIGCGDGRLTLRLAKLGAIVHANDPKPEAIAKARKNLPKRFAGRIRYKVGKAERLAYRNASFDAVVFAWSL